MGWGRYNKSAMIVAWSDSKSDEEHTINTYLMAKEEQDDGQSEYESIDEVDILALYECSKDELIDALISYAKLEQKYLSTKTLKKRYEN